MLTLLTRPSVSARASPCNGLTVAETSNTLSWSATTLSGGLDGVLVNALVASTTLSRSDQDRLVQNLTFVNTVEVVTGGNAVILSIRAGVAGTTDVKDVDIEYSVV